MLADDFRGRARGFSVAPDAITVNPMLGFDTLEAVPEGRPRTRTMGLLAAGCAKQATPAGGSSRDVRLDDGSTWSVDGQNGSATWRGARGLVGRRGFVPSAR